MNMLQNSSTKSTFGTQGQKMFQPFVSTHDDIPFRLTSVSKNGRKHFQHGNYVKECIKERENGGHQYTYMATSSSKSNIQLPYPYDLPMRYSSSTMSKPEIVKKSTNGTPDSQFENADQTLRYRNMYMGSDIKTNLPETYIFRNTNCERKTDEPIDLSKSRTSSDFSDVLPMRHSNSLLFPRDQSNDIHVRQTSTQSEDVELISGYNELTLQTEVPKNSAEKHTWNTEGIDTSDEPIDLSMSKSATQTDVKKLDANDSSLQRGSPRCISLNMLNKKSDLSERLANLTTIALQSKMHGAFYLPNSFFRLSDGQCNFFRMSDRQGLSLEDEYSKTMPKQKHHSSPTKSCGSVKWNSQVTHLCNNSYIAIIAEIIMKSPSKMVQLRDIYEGIEKNGAIARNLPRSWKGIIRHRLTVNECFIKIPQNANCYRHFWSIHPDYLEQFQKGFYTSARKIRSSSLAADMGERNRSDSIPGILRKCKSAGAADMMMNNFQKS